MPSLDDAFQQLIGHLREPGALSASRSDPFYYLVFPPEEILEIKRHIPIWSAQLRNAGMEVIRISFSDLLWDLIDASRRWEAWLEVEPDVDQEQVNDAIRNVLSTGNSLISKVADVIGVQQPNTVVFLTETEMLHPYFRVRILESALHDRIKVPTVVFYPGRRSGQFGLHFLGLYPEDGNYRATIIGGLP
jgi:bacteriophage exclusion system BrxB-like protein